MGSNPKVNQSKCLACEVCIDTCPCDAIIISKKNGKAFILQNKCVGCGACIEACPVKAIKRK